MTCKCGTELEKPATGRPPRYCSTTCRRSAEYELRRWQTLLLTAQKEQQKVGLALAVGSHSPAIRERDVAAFNYWQGQVDSLFDFLDDALAAEEGEL